MNKYLRIAPVAAAVSLACLPLSAQATNGYFSHGYGIKAKGMAGAGIAYGQDAIAAATNPANMVLVGNRVDFGLDIFSPDRSTEITGNPTATTYDPNDDDIFYIPEFGYNQMINNDMSVGVSVFGNGGMNTSYKKPIGLFGSTNAGVNLEQLFISPTFSMKVNPSNAFGVSLNLIYQRFKAEGLENFDNSSQSSAPGSVTNNGHDTSTGFNVRLGWTGEINPMVSWGVTYQSEADMSEFEDYKGLFAEQGDFDIPETYGVGIKVSPTPTFNVAFDITRINYSDVRSIANPLLPNLGAASLGDDGGAGFGWEDMTVYKLGFDWQVNPNLVLRAGWNHGEQPIPQSETFFNLLAPGVVEDHLTLGGTWTLQNGSELSFFYMHAFEETVNGENSIPGAFGGGEANLTMSQNSVGVAYGWEF